MEQLSMSLIDRISDDLNTALKARNDIVVSTLRFLISKLTNARIDKRGELTDEEVASEIGREAKRHRESIEAYEKAARHDLVEKERAELAILEKYLPSQLSSGEIGTIVDEVISQTGAKNLADFGKVMGAAMAKVRGQADGGVVSVLVRQKLSMSS